MYLRSAEYVYLHLLILKVIISVTGLKISKSLEIQFYEKLHVSYL